MSSHYTTPRPLYRWLFFAFNYGLPVLIIGATINAWVDNNKQWFVPLVGVGISYVMVRVISRFPLLFRPVAYFGFAGAVAFVFGIVAVLNARELEDKSVAVAALFFAFICWIFARTEVHAIAIKSLERATTPEGMQRSQAHAEDYPGIYRITCRANGMQYIGMTARPIKERWHEHTSHLNAGRHHNDRMQHDWSIYRPEIFAWEILEVVTDEAWLRDRERYWQDVEYETSKRYNPPNTPRRVLHKQPRRVKRPSA